MFLQYPTYDDPDNANKVVPDTESAQAMWDAINANQQLEVTHENTENDGVVVEESEAPKTPEETAAPEETTEPADPTTPPQDPAALPDNIRGNSAAQQTCSNGNVRQ